jgi:hypothetical protein
VITVNYAGRVGILEKCVVSSCGLWSVCDARLGLKHKDARQILRLERLSGMGEKGKQRERGA